MSSLSVPEAASRLGVSSQRVLQLIAGGRLPARKVGRVWVIEEFDVARYRRPSRRPLSVAMAHRMLMLAAGLAVEADDQERWRLRQHFIRLADEVQVDGGKPAELVRSLLRRRADRLEASVAASDVSEILADSRLAASGVSDPGSGMFSAQLVEGYVGQDQAKDFLADHFIVRVASQSPNVVLHVASPVPPRSPLLIAADLADYRGDREDNQARQILADWIASPDFPLPAVVRRTS